MEIILLLVVILCGFWFLSKIAHSSSENKSNLQRTINTQTQQPRIEPEQILTPSLPSASAVNVCIYCGKPVGKADALHLNDACYLHMDCYDSCLSNGGERERAIITHAHDWWPGKTPDWDMRRKAALERAGYRCEKCHKSGVPLNVHHKTPIAQHGSHLPENLEALCWDCHQSEHSHDISTDFHASYADNLALVQQALKQKKRFSLHYIDADGKETDRILTPIKLVDIQYKQYLTAYCNLERRPLKFRVDRMSNIKILD